MRKNTLFESLEKKVSPSLKVRRYSLSGMISESYKSYYDCKKDSPLQKLVESHLDDVRSNPTDLDRLSYQLSVLKEAIRMNESGQIKDEELLVPKEKFDKVVPEEKKELEESVHDEDVEEQDDEDLLEDSELTDEEVEELTKHLEELRKNKKVDIHEECDASKKEVEESTKPRKLRRANESTPVWSRYHIVNPDGETIDSYTERKDAEEWVKQLYKDGDYKRGDLSIVDSQAKNESKSYEKLNLSEFNKKSSSKAFVKTFKKLDSKLHEGTALTRQESIALYKATNSALTHLSVELEHNPQFLDTFKESVSLLSADSTKLLNSLKEGKGPSKSTMKSLAKFSEAILREEEDVEDEMPIEDEEEEAISEEEEEFDQEYAEARVELHKEIADEHAEDEDPVIQDKIQQDAEEVASLPGTTEEQVEELLGDEETPEEEGSEEEPEEEEEVTDEAKEEFIDDDITDDELAALKKYLTEMRKSKSCK